MTRIIAVIMALFFFVSKDAAYSQPIKVDEVFPVEKLPYTLKKNWVKGKPAIIYVFSSFCSASFTSLPLLQRFQQAYGNQIQFMLVGKPDETITSTYNHFAKWYNLQFDFSIDSQFYKRIPTNYLPAVIWVDESGTVKTVTGNNELTKENFEFLLSGKSVYMKNYQATEELTGILKDYKRDSSLLVLSELTQWTNEDPVGAPFEIDFEKTHFQALGITLRQLYYFAFAGKSYWATDDSLYKTFSRMIIVDTSKYKIGTIDWDRLFNYRFAIKKMADPHFLVEALQNDLNISMPYTAKLEKRVMPYWRLVVVDGDTSRIATKHAPTWGKITQARVDFTNHPLWPLLVILQPLYLNEQPIIDETGIKGNVDINFDAILSDRSSLRQGLRTAGLDLVEGLKIMDVIVLTPKASVYRNVSFPHTNN